jgi:hypothetical protein
VRNNLNKFKVSFYALSFISCCLLILFGINVFPMPGTDSRVFLTPALMLAKGKGFINPLYDLRQLKDLYSSPAQHFQFNYYVPLYSLILGTLGKIHPGIKTIFFICSLFSVTTLLLYTRTLYNELAGKLNNISRFLLLLSVPYLATYLLPTVGRPEILSSLLAMLLFLLYRNKAKYNHFFYYATVSLILGSMLATQVVCFYYSALFIVLYDVLDSKNVFKTLLVNIIQGVAAIVIFMAIVSLSPNGLFNTLHGIWIHGSWALLRVDRTLKQYLFFWIYEPLYFGFIFIFILTAIFYAKEQYARMRAVSKPQFVVACILQLGVIAGFFKFIVYASPVVYNAAQFIFPMSIFLLTRIAAIGNNSYKPYAYITTAVYSAGVVILLRWVVLFVSYKVDGRDYDNAKHMISEVVQPNSTIYISPGLWSLFEDFDKVKLLMYSHPGDTVLMQQAYSRNLEDNMQRSQVLYDWRVPARTLLGMPISNTPQCYGFVMLKRAQVNK